MLFQRIHSSIAGALHSMEIITNLHIHAIENAEMHVHILADVVQRAAWPGRLQVSGNIATGCAPRRGQDCMHLVCIRTSCLSYMHKR